jgi:hypothetical protein
VTAERDDCIEGGQGEGMRADDVPSRLELLAELEGCQLAADHPDPRGWTVATVDGWEIGHLRDLVVDTTTLEVRYLLVELWADLLDEGAHSEVLASVDGARLSPADHTVTVHPDGPDELWVYIGRHYRLSPGPPEERPAPWTDANDAPGAGTADDEAIPLAALRVERLSER